MSFTATSATALATALKARMGEEPGGPLAQATQVKPGQDIGIDDDRLTLACTDVIAAFATWGEITFDETNAGHIEEATDGVFLRLVAYKRQGDGVKDYKAWKEGLKAQLRLVTAKDRIKPSTSGLGPKTPSKDPDNVRQLTDDINPRHRRGGNRWPPLSS